MTALKRQVGGDHYKRHYYQPFNFSMDVNGSAGLTLMIRYLIRDKENRPQDIEKCKHIVELEQDWAVKCPKQFADIYSEDITEEEERLIRLFSSQFGEDAELYQQVITNMHTHQYGAVLDLLEEVK